MYNNPITVRCQCCKQSVQTIVNKEAGNVAHMWAFAICCFVGQCCCVPYLFDTCLDKTHYCPGCGKSIIRKHAKCFDIINWPYMIVMSDFSLYFDIYRYVSKSKSKQKKLKQYNLASIMATITCWIRWLISKNFVSGLPDIWGNPTRRLFS